MELEKQSRRRRDIPFVGGVLVLVEELVELDVELLGVVLLAAFGRLRWSGAWRRLRRGH